MKNPSLQGRPTLHSKLVNQWVIRRRAATQHMPAWFRVHFLSTSLCHFYNYSITFSPRKCILDAYQMQYYFTICLKVPLKNGEKEPGSLIRNDHRAEPDLRWKKMRTNLNKDWVVSAVDDSMADMWPCFWRLVARNGRVNGCRTPERLGRVFSCW